MCVAIICEGGARPSEETLEASAATNGDGAGVAWIEEFQGEPKVWWEKGLSLDDVIEFNQDLPHPYIIHFRKTSAGTNTDNLCHPFPINEKADDDLQGRADRVLFHNGTVSDWKDLYKTFVASRPVDSLMEHGYDRLSDTRMMAWMVHHQTQLVDEGGEEALLQGENMLQIMDDRSRWAILDATAVGQDRSLVRRMGTWKYAVTIDDPEDAEHFAHEGSNGVYTFEGGLLFSNSAWKNHRTKTT